MKWIKRFLCRLFGHKEPEVAIYSSKKIVVYCPRCLLIHCGEQEKTTKPRSE